MANLLGDLWAIGEPNWAGALSMPQRETAPVRENRAPTRTQDGSSNGPCADDERGTGACARGSNRTQPELAPSPKSLTHR
jgi:hypothetical protein